ncbi:MAG: LCCL domain-containing protein [Parasphingopyxis sp.]|uniref:LCCL domain-containing protein n=1 Tax=Parasphingopyxis sp. TaxID=1920299 RepID=UPI003FA15CA9
MSRPLLIAAAVLLALMIFAPRSLSNTVPPGADTCPFDATELRGTSETLACHCPAEDTNGGGIWGSVIYTDDSRICRAAVHAGAITRNGGMVRLEMLPGRDRYRGSERQGLVSQSFGEWPASYRFLWSDPRDNARALRCPDTARNIAFGEAIRCRCLGIDSRDGTVWGTGVYTDGSRICRAAAHSGVIGESGGIVIVRREAGRTRYQGSMRFGIASLDHGEWDGSFRVIAGEGNF